MKIEQHPNNIHRGDGLHISQNWKAAPKNKELRQAIRHDGEAVNQEDIVTRHEGGAVNRYDGDALRRKTNHHDEPTTSIRKMTWSSIASVTIQSQLNHNSRSSDIFEEAPLLDHGRTALKIVYN